MSIKTELSNNEFITLYGESEYVRSYSHDAKIAILDHIEMIQDEDQDGIDWTEVFMNAGEYTAADMIADNNGFEIDEHIDSLIDIASTIQFDEAIEKQLNNDDDIDNEDLWKALKDHLLGNAEFLQDAADMLGRHHGLTELDNGNWLKF